MVTPARSLSARCEEGAAISVVVGTMAAATATPSLAQQPPNIPDQKLDAAAAAIERVASLKQDYQQRIAVAAPADKERMLNEAVNALAKAVADQGLSVEEYVSFLVVAQNDPDVREKMRQRIRPSPLRKADKGLAKLWAEVGLTNPTTGIAACCARAASGHAAAAPPSATSNSRRPMVTVIRPSRARCVKKER